MTTASWARLTSWSEHGLADNEVGDNTVAGNSSGESLRGELWNESLQMHDVLSEDVGAALSDGREVLVQIEHVGSYGAYVTLAAALDSANGLVLLGECQDEFVGAPMRDKFGSARAEELVRDFALQGSGSALAQEIAAESSVPTTLDPPAGYPPRVNVNPEDEPDLFEKTGGVRFFLEPPSPLWTDRELVLCTSTELGWNDCYPMDEAMDEDGFDARYVEGGPGTVNLWVADVNAESNLDVAARIGTVNISTVLAEGEGPENPRLVVPAITLSSMAGTQQDPADISGTDGSYLAVANLKWVP